MGMVSANKFFKFIIFNFGLLTVIGFFIYSLFYYETWVKILLGMAAISLLTKSYSQYLIIEKIKRESNDLAKTNQMLEDDMNRQGW